MSHYKCKTFRDDRLKDLELQINKWLQESEEFVVIEKVQLTSSGNEYACIIFYQDLSKVT